MIAGVYQSTNKKEKILKYFHTFELELNFVFSFIYYRIIVCMNFDEIRIIQFIRVAWETSFLITNHSYIYRRTY